MSERRRFNTGERVAMYLAADGKCCECGIELEPGWHADHVTPYSKGGSTDVSNGQALCPSCNQQKGSKSAGLRHWQRRALDDFLASQHDFLVEATPGAGKTRMALAAAKELLDSGAITKMIVVVPSVNLRRQWAQSAATHDIDLTATMKNEDGAITAAKHGAVITYPQVASQRKLWRRIAMRDRTLVVLDEIHHAGTEDNAKWGAALQTAFADCSRRLLLSGTPFRTDRTPIPFVEYDQHGVAISHSGLDYGQAVRDGVVRPVRYEVLDGRADWIDLGARVSVNLSDANDKDVSDALRVLYDPSQDWVPHVFSRADAELSRAREEMPDAGGLILASSKFHAEAYGHIMSQITGEPTTVIHSEKDDAGAELSRFSKGTGRWLVAVKMVSEGVDIPRLAVGVYASRDMTEMWFRQVTGRFVRVRDESDDMTATVFIPHVQSLMDMASRIEQEADAALREAEKDARARADREQRLIELSFIEPVGASESVRTAAIMAGDVIDENEMSRAESLIAEIGGSLHSAHTADIARLLRRTGGRTAPDAVIPVPATATTGDDERMALRRQLNKAVGTYAYRSGQPHSHVHSKLNRLHGSRVGAADADGIRKRIETVSGWIEGL